MNQLLEMGMPEGMVSREYPPMAKRGRLAVMTEEGGSSVAPPPPPPPPSSTSLPPRKYPRTEPDVGGARRDIVSSSGGGGGSGGGARRGRRTVKERSQHEGTTEAQAKAIYKVYTPLDNGIVKEAPVTPIM